MQVRDFHIPGQIKMSEKQQNTIKTDIPARPQKLQLKLLEKKSPLAQI
jgi:hypothetical protein